MASTEGVSAVRLAGSASTRARTLASTRLAETWIHTVDVAYADGPDAAAVLELVRTFA